MTTTAKTLRDEAEELGIEVDGRWKNTTLRRKVEEVRAIKNEEEARDKIPDAKVTVRILKNFKPKGWYRVVGHYTNEEEYVEGQPAPPPFPGVAYDNKLWAGTVVEIPAEEARSLVDHFDDVEVVDRDPDSKLVTGRRRIRRRRPLAEIKVDWEHNAVGFEA